MVRITDDVLLLDVDGGNLLDGEVVRELVAKDLPILVEELLSLVDHQVSVLDLFCVKKRNQRWLRSLIITLHELGDVTDVQVFLYSAVGLLGQVIDIEGGHQGVVKFVPLLLPLSSNCREYN